jgi:hypothetical protein
MQRPLGNGGLVHLCDNPSEAWLTSITAHTFPYVPTLARRSHTMLFPASFIAGNDENHNRNKSAHPQKFCFRRLCRLLLLSAFQPLSFVESVMPPLKCFVCVLPPSSPSSVSPRYAMCKKCLQVSVATFSKRMCIWDDFVF